MRFVKGNHYPHPGRGPGRGAYYVSEAARRARRNNLSKSRHRSEREGKIIKLLIWQSYFDGGLQQRSLAHLLGVSPSYICKVSEAIGGRFVVTSGGTAR